jgi:hypothetical protein
VSNDPDEAIKDANRQREEVSERRLQVAEGDASLCIDDGVAGRSQRP